MRPVKGWVNAMKSHVVPGTIVLEDLCEAAISVEPCEGPFDDQAERRHLKALGGNGSLDDLDGPHADEAQGVLGFTTGIASVRKDV